MASGGSRFRINGTGSASPLIPMALLKKKADPLSERAKELNAEIAALESKIRKLNQQAGNKEVNKSGARVRSTALPHGATVMAQAPAPAPAPEPVFEEVDQNSIKQTAPQRSPASAPIEDLSTSAQKVGFLDRLEQIFRPPPLSNPKLVNYLAAGSIQGLRPLRYEKRVARNRFLALAFVLVIVLFGICAALIKHR
jgi:outer membrane murein-binding lipoprotein Lpp